MKRQLLFALGGLVLAALVLINGLSFLHLRQAELARLERQNGDHAAVVAGLSSRYIASGHDFLAVLIRDYGRSAKARLLMLDADGRVREDSFFEPGQIGRDLSTRPEVLQALAGSHASSREVTPGQATVLYAAAPVFNEAGKTAGVSLAVTNTDELGQMVWSAFRPILTVSLLTLVVASAAAIALARFLSRPVTMVTRAARAVASGQFGDTLPLPGSGELRDLTEAFNSMSRQLAALETSRQAFVADAAHELRTPAAALQALIDPLQTGAVPPAEAASFLQDVVIQVERLSRLADDLLTLSELDTARPLQYTEVAVAPLLQAARQRWQAMAAQRHVTLAMDVRPDVRLAADVRRLEQALDNVLHNAIRHSPPGGTVTISAAADDGSAAIRLTIADDGPGIPPSLLPRIFDRFARNRADRSRETGEGAGLGLAVVHDVIQAHGGSISATNRPAGGAMFTLTLPQQPKR